MIDRTRQVVRGKRALQTKAQVTMVLINSYKDSAVGVATVTIAVLLLNVVGCARTTPTESQSESTPVRQSTPKESDATVSVSTPDSSASTSETAEPSTSTSSPSAEWGTLRGQFVYDGDPPEPAFLTATKDNEICGKQPIPDESLVVNQDNRGIADIVVYLRKKPAKISASYDEASGQRVVLDNMECRFEPHVQLVRTGQTFVIGNKDAVGHNTNIGGLVGNPSINRIIPALGSHEVVFDQPERRPIQVNCNIHPWMTGFVVIKDHPYMAKTDQDGNFEMRDLPTGETIELQLWHGTGGYIRDVSGASADISKKGRVKWTLKGDFDLGTVKVKPSNFDH